MPPWGVATLRRKALSALICISFASLSSCGSDGDLVGRLYQLDQAGTSASQLSISADDLPSNVQTRLNTYSLVWSDLSGLLQRALLWDTGFVFVSDSKLIQIYTTCSNTMSDLLLDIAVLENLNTTSSTANDCTILRCSMINHFLLSSCPTDLVAPSARCAVEGDQMGDVQTSSGVYWAEDGQSTDVPDPVLRLHSSSNATYKLYAIHLTDQVFVGPESCETHGNFIIPCRDLLESDIDFCTPSYGSTLDAWLQLTAVPDPSTFSTTSLVLIIVLVAICLALGSCLWFIFRNRRNPKWLGLGARGEDSSMSNLLFSHDQHLNGSTPMDIFNARSGGRASRNDITLSNDELCSTSKILRKFVSDPAIITKRISFSHLTFLRLLSKGGNGEVWLGQYEMGYVAMKCLLSTKREDIQYLENFCEEIRLASSLEHPRIVSFCGIAWQSLFHMCAITEYMEKGDLETVLSKPMAQTLSWPKEKIVIAQDIAEALVYLHSLMPIVIHRDLKSKNVLLDRNLRAKLSDFGLSRERSVEDTMTNGVGTILWSAPEVLEGKRYDEKADIFSYGIVLSEIDTCSLPYGFNKDRQRNKMKSMHIVHLVAEGKLLPTFRDDCPVELVTLARQCLDLDPAKRPSAMQVVYHLRSKLLPLFQIEEEE